MLAIDGGRSVKQVQREMRDAVQLLMTLQRRNTARTELRDGTQIASS